VTFWALYQPSLFRSSSSIFIEPQEVPADYVRSTVTSDLEGRMRSISQRFTSRTKLLAVINKLDLYPAAMKKKVPSEVLVEGMRADLSVEVPNRRDSNFFIVHFNHRDPTKAMLAVSKLVSMFIEESLQVRELQAEGTTDFIEEELIKLKLILEKQEQTVQRYKRRYMGELPDQLEANLRMLDNLQLQMNSNQEYQRELDGRVMLLEQEISRLEGELDVFDTLADMEGSPPATNTTLNQIIEQRDEMRRRIANMESMFTSRHPDLVAARRELDRVQDILKAVSEELAKTESVVIPAPSVPQITGYSMELNNLRRQLTEFKPRLSSLRQEEVELNTRIALYQRRIESAPVREQQLTQLTRDYENTTASYEELLNKRMEAQMSENLEKRQKGEKFQILDPANFPEKPFLPNRPKLIAMGFAGGLGGGVGLALFLEALFPAFYSLKQLQQQELDVPISFGIPHISSREEAHRRLIRVTVGLVTAVIVMVGALILLDRYVIDLLSVFDVISSNVRGMV